MKIKYLPTFMSIRTNRIKYINTLDYLIRLFNVIKENYNLFIKIIKPYVMPISMVIGTLFYEFFGALSYLMPYLIFLMLFLTYSNLKLNKFRVTSMHLWLILIQLSGCLIVYSLLNPINSTLAQAAMICVLVPTGTAAPVMTGMLKGNVESLTAYSLISNLFVVLVAPIIFSLVGNNRTLPFLDSFLSIINHVFLLLLLPFVLAILMRKFTPVITTKIATYSGISFYLWSFSLLVVSGRTVEFIMIQNSESYLLEIVIAFTALFVCISQFLVGRRIGRQYENTVAGGQGLGQKNMIFGIWMVQTYLNPLASIGPGSYILWQNMINSFQVWRERKTL